MTDWTDIDLITAVAIKKPITFEIGRAFYNNPIAIAEGAPGAPKVSIDVGGQKALATDTVDTFRRLAPDGVGGVRWALPLEGGTVGLGGSGTSITDAALNDGLWSVTCHTKDTASPQVGSVGQCWILNGTILVQSTLGITASDSPAGFAVSSSRFSMSGSGASRSVSFSGGGAAGRIIAARVA